MLSFKNYSECPSTRCVSRSPVLLQCRERSAARLACCVLRDGLTLLVAPQTCPGLLRPDAEGGSCSARGGGGPGLHRRDRAGQVCSAWAAASSLPLALLRRHRRGHAGRGEPSPLKPQAAVPPCLPSGAWGAPGPGASAWASGAGARVIADPSSVRAPPGWGRGSGGHRTSTSGVQWGGGAEGRCTQTSVWEAAVAGSLGLAFVGGAERWPGRDLKAGQVSQAGAGACNPGGGRAGGRHVEAMCAARAWVRFNLRKRE